MIFNRVLLPQMYPIYMVGLLVQWAPGPFLYPEPQWREYRLVQINDDGSHQLDTHMMK